MALLRLVRRRMALAEVQREPPAPLDLLAVRRDRQVRPELRVRLEL